MLYAARECARLLVRRAWTPPWTGTPSTARQCWPASRAGPGGLRRRRPQDAQRGRRADPRRRGRRRGPRRHAGRLRVEIGTSFGPLHGGVWRIGTMGYNARRDAVLTTLAALEQELRAGGHPAGGGGVGAALAAYRRWRLMRQPTTPMAVAERVKMAPPLGWPGAISASPDGLERVYLSPEHSAANTASRRGCWRPACIWPDAAGNNWGRLDGAAPGLPALLLGSHLDTVPDAGRYDGMLGVVLAIAVAHRLRDTTILPFALEVVGFSDEEGTRFGNALLGSCALGSGTPPGGTRPTPTASPSARRSALRARPGPRGRRRPPARGPGRLPGGAHRAGAGAGVAERRSGTSPPSPVRGGSC